jgi:hypothetical protein
MSIKEMRRRKVAAFVMIEAWKLNRNTICYQLSFASSLKLAWKIIRSKIRMHHTKIVGVTYQTRQKLLCRLVQYPKHQIILKLVREPYNTHDNFSIAIVAEVMNKGKAAIGYLSSHLANVISPLMDSGHQIIVTSFDITGGSASKHYGCNLCYLIA